MIFSHTLDQVISGLKCQTRRPVKAGERFDPEVRAICKASGRVMYQVGRSYAVQPGRGKPAVGRMLITNIRRETLESISESDAHCEGFSSKADFLTTWRAIHGARVSDVEVWVIEFAVVREDGNGGDRD